MYKTAFIWGDYIVFMTGLFHCQDERMILITGATGLVGGALIQRLSQNRSCNRLIAASRRQVSWDSNVTPVLFKELDGSTDWSEALAGVTTLVHCAARVHIMNEPAADSLAEFRNVNVDGTLNLARQAAQAGVTRLVFLSSIKVNGEESLPGKPFTAMDRPAPQDAYAISKFEAEAGLRKISDLSGMEVVIVRPPLVYGPGVGANFAALMRGLSRGIPLPLGAVRTNRRSLVALDNLVDLLVTCIEHPAAAFQTFLVSDGEDLSTTDLLRRAGEAMGKSPRLLPVPQSCIRLGTSIFGREDIARRLLNNLQIDMKHTCDLLSWSPPISVDEGLRRTVRGYI